MDLIDLEQTCRGFPSQWEGHTFDGKPIYIRYRWGFLSVRLGPVGGDIMDAVDGEEIYGEQVGDNYDGIIEWEDVVNKTKLRLHNG